MKATPPVEALSARVSSVPEWVESLDHGSLPPEPPFQGGDGRWRPEWWLEFALGMLVALTVLDMVSLILEIKVAHNGENGGA